MAEFTRLGKSNDVQECAKTITLRCGACMGDLTSDTTELQYGFLTESFTMTEFWYVRGKTLLDRLMAAAYTDFIQ